jgi:amino acid adenylation domain-containing protein
VDDLLNRLASLSGAERNRLMTRLRQPAPPSEPDALRTPSDAQRRLWLLQRLEPDSPAHHLSAAFYLVGPLDTTTLNRTLSEIVARHPATRAVFPERDGAPALRVMEPYPVDAELIDLADLAPADQQAQAHRVHAARGRRPFALERGPLIRFVLYRFSAERHALSVVAHHLVCDGWSMGIFAAELAAIYPAFLDGRSSPLPGPAAHLPRERHPDSELADRAVAYWRDELAGDLPVLHLPTDRPRSAHGPARGSRHGFQLPASDYRDLQEAALRCHVTVYGMLLAAYAITLATITQQLDLVVGAPVDERRGIDEEQSIGFFVNTLPLRIQLRPGQSFAETSRAVGDVVRGALAHDLPFGDIVREANPPRLAGRPLVRQTAFSFQPAVAAELSAGTLTVIPAAPDEFGLGVSPLDLSLHIREQGDVLLGCLEYRSDLVDAATVSEWAEELQSVIRRAVRDPEATAVAPEPASDLTDSQLALYFGKQMASEERFYYENVTALLGIFAPLDHRRFSRAFAKLVEHSDALRSTFHTTDGIPVRRIHASVPARVTYVDLTDEPDPATAARRWARRRETGGLDSTRCVFDCALLRLGDASYAWYLNVDHLVCDAWSISVITRVMSEYYDLDTGGRLEEAAPLPLFQAYLDHELSLRESPRHLADQDYWRQVLACPVERIAFYGREDEVEGTTQTVRVTTDLGAELSSRIIEFARREGHASPAISFATALFAYLSRVGGGEVMRVGTPFAGRDAEFRNTIGLFMRALPLQVEAESGTTFRQLSREVQRVFAEAARHQENAPRSRGSIHLYDVYFNYQNAVFSGFGGTVKFELISTGHSPDRLTLQVRQERESPTAPPRFALDFDLNVACFGSDERERTVEHYLALLDAVLNHPEETIQAAEMLPAREREYLSRFNTTRRCYDLDTLVHTRIERQARRTPDAPAVVFEDRLATYAELNAAANWMARRIHERVRGGREHHATVAVHMERSLELVVSLLAIAKSGCAYLPVDPDTPPERMRFMLSDGDAALVLTDRPLPSGVLPDDVPVLPVDDCHAIAARSTEPGPEIETTKDDPAYLIYTSGSAGTPKCVMLTHGGLVNRLLWMQDEYGLGADDAVVQKTPFTFDVSVWEFFWPLMTGARLVVARPGGHRDPGYLAKLIQRESVTTVHFVPSMLRVFLADPAAAECDSLRRVFASGEALAPDLVGQFFQIFDPAGISLHNLYGPTEATIDVSYWQCRPEDATGPVPIGRPVANTRLEVLDDHLCPLPVGIPGQLHIGGVQLAAGYRGRDELTAQLFVPDPRRPGQRLYRTGDLVRMLPAGVIEYIGRADGQIKLRGYRIELGEIETRMAAHPSVRAAAVKVWGERLVGYIVGAAEGESPGPREMRSFLERSLPHYMVPADFIRIPTLPVTANGKLDRGALPAPGSTSRTGTTASARLPAVEHAIRQMWADLMEREPEAVGLDDNFFDLGGHSLLAARLIADVSRHFGTRLPLTAVFEAPTLRGFSRLISTGPGHSLVVTLREQTTLAPLFLIHPAGGDVMAYQWLTRLLPAGREVLGIRSRAQTGETEADTIEEMAASYAHEIRTRQPEGPYCLAGWSMGGALAVEVAAALEAAGERVALLALLDSSVPGNGTPDPLLAPAVALAAAWGDLVLTAADAAPLRERAAGLALQERLELLATWARERGADVKTDDDLLRQAELSEWHEHLMLTHQPSVVDARLTVWWAQDQLRGYRPDWARQTRGGVAEEATLPGNHFTLLRPPHVFEAARRLANALDSSFTADTSHPGRHHDRSNGPVPVSPIRP